MSLNSKGSKTSYSLDNFWYNDRQYDDAQKCWVQIVKFDDSFPVVLRNLALSYYNKSDEHDLVLLLMERVFDLSKKGNF